MMKNGLIDVFNLSLIHISPKNKSYSWYCNGRLKVSKMVVSISTERVYNILHENYIYHFIYKYQFIFKILLPA